MTTKELQVLLPELNSAQIAMVERLIASARLDEVTYWHKKTIKEVPYPSHISVTLHAQESRIKTLQEQSNE